MGWYRFTITVTTHDNAGNETPPELLARVGSTMCDLGGGGWSETRQRGGWIMPDGSLAYEDSIVFSTVAGTYGFSEHMTLRSLARHVAVTLAQDAVMVTVEPLVQGTEVIFVQQDDSPNID